MLGFTPGDDRKLASWNQVLSYFDKLDQASDRVKFEALGKTTMDVPFVMATISAPENLARLEEYKQIQELLADPRKLGAPGTRDRKAAELIRRGKTIVLITCGIHSTEVGSYLSSMLIAHRLASSNEPEIQNILKNTIILLVPSLNPDGVDIVKNWYDKTLGTPFEGTSPPELYHKYVGHDNNRDWYAFTQVETKITVRKIHNVWHPQIVHDIHQQGEFGSRLFLPPYMPPVEPNVPKQIVEGYTELGNWMARELRRAGFKASPPTQPTTRGRRRARIPITMAACASFRKPHPRGLPRRSILSLTTCVRAKVTIRKKNRTSLGQSGAAASGTCATSPIT